MGFEDSLHLPYELWELIVRELPRSDRRTCLLVSRITHDVALPLLFARILVFFGKWEFANDPIELPYAAWSHRDADADVLRHRRNTIQLLRHISKTPAFADLIREVTVAAYAVGYTDEGIVHLVEALRQLHHLTTFRYYGSRPWLDARVLEALSDGSRHSLKEVRFHCLPVQDSERYLSSRHFLDRGKYRTQNPSHTGAPWISYFDQLSVDTISVVKTSTMLSSMLRTSAHCMIRAVTDSLRHLSVPDVAWCVASGTKDSASGWGPICGLHSLELTDMSRHIRTDAQSLSSLFQNCPRLRSFTMLRARPVDINALRVSPEALPRLESLKLSFFETTTEWVDWKVDIAPFLLEKKHLRRLDIILSQGDDAADILDILPVIPTVEVLGLPLYRPRSLWSAQTLKALRDNLPVNLSVMLLSGAAIHSEFSPPEEWVKLLHGLRTLRYIQFLYPESEGTTSDNTVDLTENLLKDPPEGLELVGDGPRLRWIDRAFKPAPVYTPHWPLSAVWFRSAADFGRADKQVDKFGQDCEWVLRHHDVALFDSRDPSGFGPFFTEAKRGGRRVLDHDFL